MTASSKGARAISRHSDVSRLRTLASTPPGKAWAWSAAARHH
ncbi:hypothetical protein ACFCXK_20025 [Streptomyces sp. NPDC056269]